MSPPPRTVSKMDKLLAALTKLAESLADLVETATEEIKKGEGR